MHLIADDLGKRIDLPIIHIAEATGKAVQAKGLSKAGLLGTRFTMEMDFFKKKLAALGIESIIPGEGAREFIHETIFGELGRGVLEERTKRRYLDIVEALRLEGAQGVILACTEIPLLLKQGDSDLPLFDTTLIHAQAAVDFIVGSSA
jgi:aspartate racemase